MVVSNGWSTNNAIGSQGAQFAAGTVGYYQIQVSFDVYATADAEANLQVQYATDGKTWQNATITSAGSAGTIANNTNPTNGIVVGSYVKLPAGWNNQVTVNLSGISGVDNDANLAFRIVNASMGTNCVDTTGAIFNSATATWTFDNVVITGVSFDSVVDWTFESTNYPNLGYVPNPVPEINPLGNYALAQALGMSNTYVYANGALSSTNDPDITSTAGSSTPTAQGSWRVRGQGFINGHGTTAGNGWNRSAPIGTQGAEFDVSTLSYTNIIVSFDLYSTSQGEGKMCVLYTTDGWATTNVANNIAYGANPSFIVSNAPVNMADYSLGGSSNTVTGTYFYQTTGQNFYNNIIVDFTGVPGVSTNSQFGFKVVNAATGNDCTYGGAGLYNNSSGNWRYDNVAVSGQFEGSPTPVLTNAPSATVDNPFTLTFADDSAWRSQIGSIYVNSAALPTNAYTISAGQITLTPSNSAVLQLSGLDYIVVNATNYVAAKVTQPLLAGVFSKYTFTQPAGPTASGGTLTVNPSLVIADQYGNGSTNPYSNVSVTATVSNSPATWTLGGATTAVGVNGVVNFTNLSATLIGSSAITNAAIIFTVTGGPISVTNSTAFTIGVAPVPFTPGNLAVLQGDVASANNSTFSIIEIKPSAAGQTKPVNIVPISATGANPMRFANSGSAGKLALSDNGKFLCFAGYQDGSAATPDETYNLNRAVGTLDYTNKFTMQASYVSQSYGGSQARAACSPDNNNFAIVDKYGIYLDSNPAFVQNNISIRSFGGLTWVLTAKTHIPAIPCFYQFQDNTVGDGSIDYNNVGNDGVVVNDTGTPFADQYAQDFYMISSNGNYSTLYISDQNSGTNGTSGVINKFVGTLDGDGAWDWVAMGSWTNSDNQENLFATTNGSGGVYLYYANGSSTAKNSIIRLTDSTIGGALNIISTNTIYTAPTGTTVYGMTFVPQATAYATELIPPPILTAQTTAPVSGNIFITNTPDDGNWRSNITAITVNGALLPTTAYGTNTAGFIVLIPSASPLLQTNGSKTILIAATGYSTNSVTQTLAAGAPNKLAMKTEPSASVIAGAAFATPPAVYIEDIYGNVVTTATSNVVAQISTGAGSLTGTTTIAAVGGVATFTSALLAPTVAQSGLFLKFTNSSLGTIVDTTSITVKAVPVVTTLPAANVYALSATLGGAVNPNGAPTTYWFNYGTSISYGISTTPGILAAGFSSVITNVALGGLQPGTVYHYQIVATNNVGTAINGSDATFTTLQLGGNLTGGLFEYVFTNSTGGSFSILATNDLTIPESNWPTIGTAMEAPSGSGQYIMTNQITPTNPVVFFTWKTNSP
jgi:hypothetical protein